MTTDEVVIPRVGMPMDEFIRQFDQAPFELIGKHRRALIPTVSDHGEVIRFLL